MPLKRDIVSFSYNGNITHHLPIRRMSGTTTTKLLFMNSRWIDEIAELDLPLTNIT